MRRLPEQLKSSQPLTGLRFARRMYLMRMLGTLLCFSPILSVLLEQQRSPVWLLLLSANAFVWPTVAFLRARRAVTPKKREHQHLVLDAAAGGFWIATIALCSLPSVVIATILVCDRLSAGGIKLMRKALLAMTAAFLVTWLAQGMPFRPQVSVTTLYATLPLIAIYILALSLLTNAISRQLSRKTRELERIAMTDPFLDIANRRLLELRIHNELSKLTDSCHSSALMFIDIDNFKEANDRFGHKAGDTLLVAVSDILRYVTRDNGTPARLGGDEFVVLLPNTSAEEASAIARTIMDRAAQVRVFPDNALNCTLSIGIACATAQMASVTDWLKAADDALYNAKREGKNRIFAC